MVKQSSKKVVKKQTDKVDFEPNKMGLTVATAAVVLLTLIAVLAMQG
jgi:hypothetical protein